MFPCESGNDSAPHTGQNMIERVRILSLILRFVALPAVDSGRTLKEGGLRESWNWFGIGVSHVCMTLSATLSMSVFGTVLVR